MKIYRYIELPFTKEAVMACNLDELRKLTKEVDKDNEHIYNEKVALSKKILADIKELYGDDSKQYKYMKSHNGVSTYPIYNYRVDDIESRKKEFLKKIADDEICQKREQENAEILKGKKSRAVLFLQRRGLQLGEDFEADDAYQEANRLVRNEYIDSMQGKEIDIDCCSECNKWIVGEHRCSCGNRRMYVEYDGDFEEHCIRGEAD